MYLTAGADETALVIAAAIRALKEQPL